MNANNLRTQERYRIPNNLLAQIELLAKSKGTSRNEIVCTAITEYIGKNTGNEAIFTKVMNNLSSSFKELTATITAFAENLDSHTCESQNVVDRLNNLLRGQDEQFLMELCILNYFRSTFHNDFTERDLMEGYPFLNKFISEYHTFVKSKGDEYYQRLFNPKEEERTA